MTGAGAAQTRGEAWFDRVQRDLASRDITLDDGGREVLRAFLSRGDARLAEVTLAEPFDEESALGTVTGAIQRSAHGPEPITAFGLREIIRAICPLFPFC